MNIVILNRKQELPTILASDISDLRNNALVAVTGKEKFLLMYMPPSTTNSNTGYIFFKTTAKNYGHTGYHATIELAVKAALDLDDDTKIYQFDNHYDAAKFITS